MNQADSGGDLVYDALEESDEPEAEAKPDYTLSLTGPDLTFKRLLTSDVALAVMNLVMAGAVNIHAEASAPLRRTSNLLPRGDGASSRVGSVPPRSLREYIDSTGATQYPQKILAIANYLVDERGLDQFTRDEVKSQFSTARERLPANYNRDFAVALQNGWLAEDHVSKKFYVTGTGHSAINDQFSSEGKRSSRPARRRPRRRSVSGESESA